MTGNIATLTGSTELTMTSLEIAGLVNSIHADVRRSIERLAERGIITLQPLAEVSNPGAGPRFIKVYHVGKRDSYVIVAQLSPEFTARLVDRWQELEGQVARPTLPNFEDPADAAVAWAEQFRARQALRIEVDALTTQVKRDAIKVEALDNFLGNTLKRGQDCSTVAKELAKDYVIGRTRLLGFLRKNGVINEANQPHQRHVDCDRFYLQIGKFTIGDETHVTASLRVTPKGSLYIRYLLDKHEWPRHAKAASAA